MERDDDSVFVDSELSGQPFKYPLSVGIMKADYSHDLQAIVFKFVVEQSEEKHEVGKSFA